MDTTSTSCSKSRLVGEALIIQLMPYARKAARGAFFKWDIDQDDVFQVIMEDAWKRIDGAIAADVPIAWMRKNMGFSIGRAIQEKFWRKGNDVTDNTEDDHTAPEGVGIEVRIDMRRAFDSMPEQSKKAFSCLHVFGYTQREAGEAMGMTASGVAHHFDNAMEYMIADTRGTVKPKEKKKLGFLYHFVHDDGREVRATFNDAVKECGLSAGSVSQIKTGKRDKVNGWRMG